MLIGMPRLDVLRETTVWEGNIPNHTYALSSTKLVGYVNALNGMVVYLAHPIQFDKRRRTFVKVRNTFGFKVLAPEARVTEKPIRTVQGSKGNVYQIFKTRYGERCNCPGYGYRGKCKHIMVAK